MTVTLISLISLIIYVPASLEAPLAFILLPINACINPLINTITTTDFMEKLKFMSVELKIWLVGIYK